MIGFYAISFLLIAALVIDPELTKRILLSVGMKIEVYILNLRMKWVTWRLYRGLVKMCKESGFPDPGPFKYVDIWDRDS